MEESQKLPEGDQLDLGLDAVGRHEVQKTEQECFAGALAHHAAPHSVAHTVPSQCSLGERTVDLHNNLWTDKSRQHM